MTSSNFILVNDGTQEVEIDNRPVTIVRETNDGFFVIALVGETQLPSGKLLNAYDVLAMATQRADPKVREIVIYSTIATSFSVQ